MVDVAALFPPLPSDPIRCLACDVICPFGTLAHEEGPHRVLKCTFDSFKVRAQPGGGCSPCFRFIRVTLAGLNRPSTRCRRQIQS